MRFLFSLIICFYFISFQTFSQEDRNEQENDSIVVGDTAVDEFYREDQFYVGFSFNLLANRPKGVTQSGFSGGLHFGFIRDMPINKKRTLAFGAGAGVSFNSYGLNLLINKDGNKGKSTFSVLDDIDYETNRFTSYLIEAPLQFRWRSSTPNTYKFWRIYAGVRIGYLYHFRANYEDDHKKITHTKIDGLNRVRTAATFTFGYNTFNFHIYYSLNPFFDAQTVDKKDVGLNAIKIGFMFYLL